LIEAFRQRHPKLPQVACFDTAFHCTMPRVAKLLPIPRRFEAKGIRRYGFHGLSYAYLIEELARVAGKKAAQGRVILAHLGSGASLAAVREGKSIDTSMGFTPAGGLTMGTRPGDLDPGVAWYMIRSENLTPAQFNKLINHESGLLGISETSSDMQDLLARETMTFGQQKQWRYFVIRRKSGLRHSPACLADWRRSCSRVASVKTARSCALAFVKVWDFLELNSMKSETWRMRT
jgi:acetate kinase